MGLSVKDRGKAVATFRYINVELMEMLAQWTPTSPEMEVKLMFGEHIWDIAQNADAFGKRTRELRMPLHHSLKPVEPYVEMLAAVREETDTVKRLASFYDVILPSLDRRYHAYLEHTDSLMDAPSVRVLQQSMDVGSRMARQCEELRSEFPALGEVDRDWLDELTKQESQIPSLVA